MLVDLALTGRETLVIGSGDEVGIRARHLQPKERRLQSSRMKKPDERQRALNFCARISTDGNLCSRKFAHL